jgi:hypothetical protein
MAGAAATGSGPSGGDSDSGRPSGCAPSLILPLSRRCDLPGPSWPGRNGRSGRLRHGASLSNVAVHSSTVRDRPRKCRIDSIEIYSRVLNSKLRSRSWVRLRPAVGCAAVAPLRRCIGAPLRAVRLRPARRRLGRGGRVAAPPSLIRPLRLGRAAAAAAAAAPRRPETAQRLAARHASGV